MSHCNHECFIIPKYIKEILIKQGLMNKEAVKKALAIDKSIRAKRTKTVSNLMAQGLAGIVSARQTTKIANRTIYNCQNTENLTTSVVLRTEKNKADVPDADANLSFKYGGVVRDYYSTFLNRNSLDNKGLDLDFYVHYSQGYNNAFWDG